MEIEAKRRKIMSMGQYQHQPDQVDQHQPDQVDQHQPDQVDQVIPQRFRDFHYSANAMCVNEVITALYERFKAEPRVSIGAAVGVNEYAYDVYVDDMRIVRISAAKKFQQDAVDDLIIGFSKHNSLSEGLFVSEVFFNKHRLMFMMMQYVAFIMSGSNNAYLVNDDNTIVHLE